MTTIQAVPDNATLFEIAQSAAAQHLHLIHKGDRFALCSVIPAGWQKFSVTERNGKSQKEAA